MKTIIIGDMHLKEKMGYADFVEDGRKKEKSQIFKQIKKLSSDCDRIVFLGDQLNGRNNPSEVIREFVEFVESLGSKDIYIIAGNHEKTGDGKSAIDFMKEVKKKNWNIVTNEILNVDGDVFCPYFYKGELGANSHEEAINILMEKLPGGGTLFIHHAVSGYKFKNISTDTLNEIVLPRTEIKKRFKNTFCGHIHTPGHDKKNNIIYVGSVFTNEVNEEEKFIYLMEDGELTQVPLVGRPIIKLEDPSEEEIKSYPKNAIIKVILSKKIKEDALNDYKKILSNFDGSILVEDFKVERKAIKFDDDELNLNIDNLIKIYSENRKIDLNKLQKGYDLIK